MRLEDSKHNPLRELLNYIPNDGLVLDRGTLAIIARILVKGGIICEEFDEVVTILEHLEKETGLIEVKHELTKFILRKSNGDQKSI